jgi:hypothetical protein
VLSEFEISERECYCIDSFVNFLDETHQILALLDATKPELPN